MDAVRPEAQAQAFTALLDRKAGWFKAAEVTFGLGVSCLGGALIVALLTA